MVSKPVQHFWPRIYSSVSSVLINVHPFGNSKQFSTSTMYMAVQTPKKSRHMPYNSNCNCNTYEEPRQPMLQHIPFCRSPQKFPAKSWRTPCGLVDMDTQTSKHIPSWFNLPCEFNSVTAHATCCSAIHLQPTVLEITQAAIRALLHIPEFPTRFSPWGETLHGFTENPSTQFDPMMLTLSHHPSLQPPCVLQQTTTPALPPSTSRS